MAYVRTVRTASGATAVQTVYSSRRGSRQIEHVGSAHNEAELAALRIAAAARLATGQAELDLDLKSGGDGSVDRPLDLVLARIIESTSKQDWLRCWPRLVSRRRPTRR